MRDGHYSGAKEIVRALDYKYPHSYEDAGGSAVFTKSFIKSEVYEPKLTSEYEQTIAWLYEKINRNKK
ncbi:hypothetical protein HBQ08_05570 [Listeria booriae]|uniref:Uncharacterized protein n=1 Tax=Listeria booriae TaxID=1552123 RepID=A0A7X0TM71_9LIST|nr:hypothetical protein [Listeria booriae]MBC1307176.1 hypothetical protein [Listeria booriae]MBC1331417.1 hypothetical protein [Listeria booriae]MBC2386727.1 hypothetical protein [Listeria booriae]